jgi:glycosyltransferase involved in cell wall biosynthesis
MACGTPSVCSDIPRFREVAGDAAVYAPPRDTSAFAAAALRLLHDPAARRSLSHLAIARAATFDWDRTADAILDVLAEVAR